MLSKTNKCYRIRYKGIKLLYRNTNIIINVTINHYRIIIYCLTERSFVKLGLSCLPAHWRMYDPCSLVTQNFGQSFQRSIRICLLFPTTAMHQINYSLPASGQCACVCPVNVASLMMNYFVTYPLTTFSRARQIKTSISRNAFPKWSCMNLSSIWCPSYHILAAFYINANTCSQLASQSEHIGFKILM